jgi:hypothetical protein
MTPIRHRPLPASGSRRSVVVLCAVLVAALLAGCGGQGSHSAEAAAGAGHQRGLPSAHVHGVAVNPGDGLVYLATHDGLFRYDAAGPTRVGPVIDLMGFTVAGPDTFYASGHPGPGVDLPDPVGLLRSTDAGKTWTPLSMQGRSDFHALVASGGGVVGYDGVLRTSRDGTTWRELPAPVSPHSLAASPDGTVLLATTEEGLRRSADAGASWATVASAPLLLVVGWAGGDTVTGVTPDGTVAVSTDAGATWRERGRVDGAPQALGASIAKSGGVRVLVVTDTAVLDSADGGVSFGKL